MSVQYSRRRYSQYCLQWGFSLKYLVFKTLIPCSKRSSGNSVLFKSFLMKTKALNVFWTLVLFLSGLNSAQTAFFMISRTTPPGDDGWENGVDHFTVSSSICNQTSEYNCTYFKGKTLDFNSCNCECPTSKTTFALTEGKWPRCSDLGNSQGRAKLQFGRYDKPGVKGTCLELSK